MSKTKAAIGVIGCGAVAQLEHIPAIRKLPNAQLLALCDRDKAKLQALARKHEVPHIFENYEEMLELEELDGVVIATPNYLHAPMTIAALRRGKHVLCEKPMALSAREARDMADAASRFKRKLLVGFNHRFRQDVQILKQFIEGKELGKVFYVKTGWLRHKGDWKPQRWTLQKERSGGGVFLDLGIHMLDLALWLLGNPPVESVTASAYHLAPKSEVEDSAAAFIKVRGGATIMVEVSWTLLYDKDFTYVNFFGDNGAALLNPLRILKELHGNLVNVTPMVKPPAAGYRASYEAEMSHFVDCITSDTAPLVGPVDGVQLTKIMDAIYASARKGREVRVF
jgi:predicted dehydrogenase